MARVGELKAADAGKQAAPVCSPLAMTVGARRRSWLAFLDRWRQRRQVRRDRRILASLGASAGHQEAVRYSSRMQ